MLLTWKRTAHSVEGPTVYTSQPDGEYALIGTLVDPSTAGKVTAYRRWRVEHQGREVETIDRLADAKGIAQRHHDQIFGSPRPRHAATSASLRARIADAITEAHASGDTAADEIIRNHAVKIADTAVKVLAEPWPGINVSRCTHGGDCPVHPDVRWLHNFDATAGDVLGAVLAAVEARHTRFDADDVREIAEKFGVEVRF